MTRVSSKGDIPSHIKTELEKRGKKAKIGPISKISQESEVIVSYRDLWGWDMADILKALIITFKINKTNEPILQVSYTQPEPFHGFPSPEKEIPNLMKKAFDETAQ